MKKRIIYTEFNPILLSLTVLYGIDGTDGSYTAVQ